ncbi:hypothetical protein M758_1G293200 [Ceratodon purpureus]|nr:hypothetical protein M758_1G293200 [Ceratodon purpureus]
MSLEGSQSPAPSSSSDDFAALLDAELLGDRHSSPDVLEGDALGSPEVDNGGKSSESEEDSSEEVSEEEEEESDVDILEDQEEELVNVESDQDILEELSRKRRREDDPESPTVSDTGASDKCPPHPGFIYNICIRCGERKSTIPTNDPVKTHVGLRYIHEGLEVSELEATRVRDSELKRVNAKQKLLLVVDLDHTVLNSARFSEVPAEERIYLSTTYLRPNPPNSNETTVGEQQGSVSSLHQLTRLGMWTKLRPFAHKFLEEASKMYEMYVYTMGERVYALAMASLLDPTGQLFGDRIISQTDSTKRLTKDLDVVLGADSAVVILDDTEGVWPNHRSNLILMERYHFFTSSVVQFGVRAPSLAQLHRDESETEGTLATTLKTLRAIHHEYFNGHGGQNMKRKPLSESPDVRQVIRKLRAKLLAGCNIVLGPEIHPLWQLPTELGAQCSTSCDHTTTHVVALDPTTDKALWAKEHEVFLVHPRWVDAACYLWSRPPEKDFPVTNDQTGPSTTTFAKNVLVEPRGVDDTNDKVEVVGPSPSDGAVVPPVHVNGSAGGGGSVLEEKVVDNESIILGPGGVNVTD